MKFLVALLLVVAGVTASAQTYIDFRKPMRLLYGGDTLIISLQGDSVIFSGKAAELVLRDSTLLEIIQAHGGSGGGGVVDTAGGQVAGQIAYWTDKNTLDGNSFLTCNATNGYINSRAFYARDSRSYIHPGVSNGYGNIANRFGTTTTYTDNSKILEVDNIAVPLMYVKADSSVFNNYLVAKDSIFYIQFVGSPAGSIWWTNSVTGAIDSAHTEPAYIGWEMKDLPTLDEYMADTKMINGHLERRIWYIDYETKELKSQYGWDGLGMMNTQSAYMIYHEITVRWMFEQNKKLEQNKRSVLKRKVKNLEQRLYSIEKALSVPVGVTTLEHRK